MEQTADRIARNQAAFREANERIEAAVDGMGQLEALPLLCECPKPRCTVIVRMPRDEYERVRSEGDWFLVAPGHEPETEVAQVQEEHDGYTVMRKIGEAGTISRELDPRSALEETA